MPAPSFDWTAELADQLAYHWDAQLRPRLDGLTDDEYRWEPVPGCWSVRPRSDATTPFTAGAGDLVIDWAYPEPEPAPVTTIAWRLGHLLVGVLGARNAAHFGAEPISYQDAIWPHHASEALDALDAAYATWMTGVRSSTPGSWLPRAVRPRARGATAAWRRSCHIHREVVHHGAEVALLRDLYRAGGHGG
ncbi:MAG: DinB family protein [Acidimicrobiales bacterium]